MVFDALKSRIATAFGYDVLEPRGRRKGVTPSVYREDHHVKGTKHRHLSSTASELSRNLSLAMWMVRRHLDYVSLFEFRSRTGDEALDAELERLMKVDSLPSRADVSGKFGREKLFRLAETRRVLDGDTLLIKIAPDARRQNVGRLQGLQADLIADPPERDVDREQWINGVQITQFGRPLAFGVYARRGYTGKQYVRRIDARNGIFYGFFDRYAHDQVRGVSPLVTALAPLQDVYENFSYALAKAKVSQLLALAFYRDQSDPVGDITAVSGAGTRDQNGDDVGDARKYKVDFGSGPQVFNLDPGDRVEFIESKSPSKDLQDFTTQVIQVALKALDIPMSFYDEARTNFFGSRAAWLHYERSCIDKRNDQIEMRRQYTVWKLQEWLQVGRLTLPGEMRITDVDFEWVPKGMPWWDPSKEISGHVQAIQSGLDTPQRVCRATGTDYYDNIDEIDKAIEYARDRGVPVQFALEMAAGVQSLGRELPGASDEDVDESDSDTEREATP